MSTIDFLEANVVQGQGIIHLNLANKTLAASTGVSAQILPYQFQLAPTADGGSGDDGTGSHVTLQFKATPSGAPPTAGTAIFYGFDNTVVTAGSLVTSVDVVAATGVVHGLSVQVGEGATAGTWDNTNGIRLTQTAIAAGLYPGITPAGVGNFGSSINLYSGPTKFASLDNTLGLVTGTVSTINMGIDLNGFVKGSQYTNYSAGVANLAIGTDGTLSFGATTTYNIGPAGDAVLHTLRNVDGSFAVSSVGNTTVNGLTINGALTVGGTFNVSAAQVTPVSSIGNTYPQDTVANYFGQILDFMSTFGGP
jgi:hypothetical protein